MVNIHIKQGTGAYLEDFRSSDGSKPLKVKKRNGPAPESFQERIKEEHKKEKSINHSPMSSMGKEHRLCDHHYRKPSSPISRTKEHEEYVQQLYREEDRRRE